MRETGTVIRLRGNRAAISIEGSGGEVCAKCAVCQQTADRKFVLWVQADGLAEGNKVTVEVPMPSPWRGMLLVFGLPVAGLVVGLVVGSQWTRFQEALGLGPQSAGLAVGGALGVLCFALALVEGRRFERRNRPRVVHVKHTV